MSYFAPISSKIKLSGMTNPRDYANSWMDEEARRLRRIGSIEEIGFSTSAE